MVVTSVQSAAAAALDAEQVREAAARELPLPGAGATHERWRGLADLGRTDLALAKVVEPHHDAQAICHDLGHPMPRPGTLWEVWAAEPPGTRLEAIAADGGWRLSGRKPFCSGAGLATHALVTAEAAGESRLFAVDVAAGRADGTVLLDPSAWAGPGMAAADTRTLRFAAAEATAVGPLGCLRRTPRLLARRDRRRVLLGRRCLRRRGDPAGGVAAGAPSIRTRRPTSVRWPQPSTAAAPRCGYRPTRSTPTVDDESLDQARYRAESVRATVVAAAEEIVTRVGHALGPAPLALDAEHARRVADLQVFLRQHHAERDLAALGGLARDSAPW